MSDRIDDLPCGRCDAGIYDSHPFLVGVEMFRNCVSRKEALRSAPLCKRDNSHVCFGARDFIACTSFPMTEQAIAAIKTELGAAA